MHQLDGRRHSLAKAVVSTKHRRAAAPVRQGSPPPRARAELAAVAVPSDPAVRDPFGSTVDPAHAVSDRCVHPHQWLPATPTPGGSRRPGKVHRHGLEQHRQRLKVVNPYQPARFGASVAFLAATGVWNLANIWMLNIPVQQQWDARHGHHQRRVRHRRGVQGGPRPRGGPFAGQRGAGGPLRGDPGQRAGSAWATCDRADPVQPPIDSRSTQERSDDQSTRSTPAAGPCFDGVRRPAGLGPGHRTRTGADADQPAGAGGGSAPAAGPGRLQPVEAALRTLSDASAVASVLGR